MSTGISWAKETWNPVAGCAVISPGCTHCCAMLDAHGKANHPNPKTSGKYKDLTRKSGGRPKWTGDIRLWPQHLDKPRTFKDPCWIFVNSMSDLFHEGVPLDYIQQCFTVMRETPRHGYQILTKRAERLATLAPSIDWPANVLIGVSVENDDYTSRIDHLRTVPAAMRFLSLEPLLGPLNNLDLTGIGWVIAGGESGPGHRPPQADWFRSIRDQCARAGIPFHFKQWGGIRPNSNGRTLDGREHLDMPALPATNPQAAFAL